MDTQPIKLSELVQQTLLVPDLARKKPWTDHVNWLDQLCAVTNLIPLAGGIVASEIRVVADSINNYKVSEFLRKFVRFVYELGDVNDEDRIQFLNELEEKAQDASGNVIISIIDRMDNINKQKILANLVKAKCEGHISIEEFLRLESVLQRIPYVDLVQLPLYQTEYYDENGDSELLYSTGVLRPAIYYSDGDKYVLSVLGVNLMRWGLWLPVEMPNINGTSTGIDWEEIGDIPDREGVKNIVKKTIEEQRYMETDQAMFDYDVARGK